MITIRIDGAQKVIKTFNRLVKFAEVDVRGVNFDEAEKARSYAFSIAPEYTGSLKEAIVTRPTKNGYSVVAKTPVANNPKRTPYQIYLQLGKRGRYKGTTKSGDHQFMVTTYNLLKKGFPNRIEQELDKVLKS